MQFGQFLGPAGLGRVLSGHVILPSCRQPGQGRADVWGCSEQALFLVEPLGARVQRDRRVLDGVFEVDVARRRVRRLELVEVLEQLPRVMEDAE